ncbi:MAG: heavy metal-binding domain-containing protein [Rhodovarius sp.]|nr:heavy metal-binding domain-containing protein [Rhodovarius sp.]
MIFTTTSRIEGREIETYLGVVFGDAVLGVNIFKDLLGGLRDLIGGRSATWERELGRARDAALANLTEQARALGADAVVGLDLDYEVLGGSNGMLMVSARGTAVRLKPASPWRAPGAG